MSVYNHSLHSLLPAHILHPSPPHLVTVVVLTEVDQLTKDAQHALRRTMEKYMTTCRLVLCCNSTSKVTPAIKSRCLGVRVAAPTNDEVILVINLPSVWQCCSHIHLYSTRCNYCGYVQLSCYVCITFLYT